MKKHILFVIKLVITLGWIAVLNCGFYKLGYMYGYKDSLYHQLGAGGGQGPPSSVTDGEGIEI